MKALTKARFAATLALVLLASPAWAQVYNPATPGVPPPILPPTPPQAQPGMAPIPPAVGESSRTSQTRLPGGMSPGRAARETTNDRAVRCAHQGAALGVPAGAQGQYTRECVNN